MEDIKSILFINKEEMGEFNPYTYEDIGELILSYLNLAIKEDKLIDGIHGIVETDTQEELWNIDCLNFKEEFKTSNAMISHLAIGYVGFGTITIKGLTFKAVAECNASPYIVYVSERSRNIIEGLL